MVRPRMARDGKSTRQKILDAAEKLVLADGFAATTIDQVIERVGVTKGAFFHHFKSKGELARALIERYAETDRRLLYDNLARAEKLSDDPLQQLIIFVGLFQEVADALETPYPGCLFGSYCYESGQFDDEVLAVISTVMREWREVLGAKIRTAMSIHPPRVEVDPDTLADMITAVFEGSFIMSRILQDPRSFAQQLKHYRNYLELLFGVK